MGYVWYGFLYYEDGCVYQCESYQCIDVGYFFCQVCWNKCGQQVYYQYKQEVVVCWCMEFFVDV